MGNLQLVGHYLEGMLAVGLPDLFMKLYAVADSKNGVGTVDCQEYDIGEISCLENQLSQGEKNDKSHGERPDVARKARRLLPEIEEAERQQTQPYDIEIRHVDESLFPVEIYQRQKHYNGISAGDPVDSVHEVVGIDDTDTYYERYDNDPPIMKVEDAELIEHQEHCRKLD